MKKRMISLVAVALLLLSVSANASDMSIQSIIARPTLSFSGTTAICSATVTSGTSSDIITLNISLWCGNTRVGYWSTSGSGMVSINKTCTVVKGNTYELILNSTINGIAQPSEYVTGTC